MQYAYVFSVLGYQAAHSYVEGKSLTIESMQKASFIMLLYAIGKYFFIYPISKFQKNASRSIVLYITGGICLFNITGQFIIVSTSLENYNAGWFVVAFAFGLQNAVLCTKCETGVINMITELKEEYLDTCMLGKFAGGLLIFLLGGALKTNKPQILLAILLLFLLASFAVSFLRTKREIEPEKPKMPLKEELVEEQKTDTEKVDILPGDSGMPKHNK